MADSPRKLAGRLQSAPLAYLSPTVNSNRNRIFLLRKNSTTPAISWLWLDSRQSKSRVPKSRFWDWETTNPMRANSEPLAPPQVAGAADYFLTSSHNDLGSLPANHRPGRSSSRRLAVGRGWQRPKHRVTPYPGIFYRELFCFDDFTAQPCP
jgi:hypothetical protein